MTKDNSTTRALSLPFARVALALAALIAIAAIAIALLRPAEKAPPTTTASAPQPVGDVASMISGLEKKMAENPGDSRGWHLLGLAYYDVGRYADAITAYGKAAELEPNKADHWSALGEVQVLGGPGGIVPAAQTSFRKALAIDPKDFRARYFMAVKKNEDGAHKQAVDDLIDIARESPADAPWAEPVRQLATKLATQHGIDVTGRLPAAAPPAARPGGDSVATAGIPGPSAADLKAATSMTPAQQDEMARGMVDRLAARLKENPRDADRWIMLMRARMVLKDPAGAATAYRQAKATFADDAAQQTRFDEAARTLGVSR